MNDEIKLLIFFIIGLFSAYFGSFSSGGVSAIAISLMVMVGTPPQMAGIIFKLGKIGDTLGGLYHFYKGGHIPRKYILGGGIAMFLGSFVGSYLIVSISDFAIYLGCGLSMLLLTAVSVFKKPHIGGPIPKWREYCGYVSFFVLSTIGNLFPAGSGVWYYFNNTLIMNLTPLQSKGVASILAIFWFFGTLLGILTAGYYDFASSISLAIGMFIGGYFGTKHIIKIGNHMLGNIMLITIVLFAFYFLYNAYTHF